MTARKPFVPLACLALVFGCAAAAAPPESITLDGEFDDWAGIPDAVVDPADAPGAAIDFGRVRINDDPQYVDLLVELGRTVNVQALDGRGLILLDADGDPDTGRRAHDLEGVDLVIELTPANTKRPDQPGRGIGLVSSSWQPDPRDPNAKPLSPYLVGFSFAPTHASDRVELRLRRGTDAPGARRILTGRQFTAQLVFLDRDGGVADATAPMTHEFSTTWARKSDVAGQTRDPLARPAGRTLRIVSWNAEFGSMFSKPGPFARVLKALDPDVVLFQELRGEDTAEQVHEFMRRAVPADRWLVLVGAGGGNLRCGVASRLPMSEAPALDLLTYPDRPDRSLRVAAASVEFDGRRVLVASVHLKCCGSLDSREDRTRQEEAGILNRAIAAALDGSAAGIVIAGDLNLVGGRGPLETLAAGRDLDGSDLAIASPLQLDGRSNATWSDTGQPFVPGRLDYLLFSDAALRTTTSFVFDSTDLAPRWLRTSGVRPDDTAAASDHLPLVVDLSWAAGD
ncbi:MAG: endonuclease/exonuclease/phosphatase family protein [Planctomycetota bacterium]